MNTCKYRHGHALLLLLLSTTAVAGAAYTWTDSEGVRHFSESVPADIATDAEPVELKSAPVIPGPPPDRFRSMSDQAARMQADRLKREQLREKRRQLAATRDEKEYAGQHEADGQSNLYPYYPYPVWYPPPRYPRHPHHGHHHYPRPHPGFEAGKTITQQRNAEALRNQRWHW